MHSNRRTIQIKSKTKTITTPVGIGRYTWLNNPDKTYDEAYGVYRTDLILSEEDWNAFKLEVKPLYEQALADEQVKQGKKKQQEHESKSKRKAMQIM